MSTTSYVGTIRRGEGTSQKTVKMTRAAGNVSYTNEYKIKRNNSRIQEKQIFYTVTHSSNSPYYGGSIVATNLTGTSVTVRRNGIVSSKGSVNEVFQLSGLNWSVRTSGWYTGATSSSLGTAYNFSSGVTSDFTLYPSLAKNSSAVTIGSYTGNVSNTIGNNASAVVPKFCSSVYAYCIGKGGNNGSHAAKSGSSPRYQCGVVTGGSNGSSASTTWTSCAGCTVSTSYSSSASVSCTGKTSISGSAGGNGSGGTWVHNCNTESGLSSSHSKKVLSSPTACYIKVLNYSSSGLNWYYPQYFSTPWGNHLLNTVHESENSKGDVNYNKTYNTAGASTYGFTSPTSYGQAMGGGSRTSSYKGSLTAYSAASGYAGRAYATIS